MSDPYFTTIHVPLSVEHGPGMATITVNATLNNAISALI